MNSLTQKYRKQLQDGQNPEKNFLLFYLSKFLKNTKNVMNLFLKLL